MNKPRINLVKIKVYYKVYYNLFYWNKLNNESNDSRGQMAAW